MAARKIDRNEVIRLRSEGWTTRQIARHFNASESSIYRHLGGAEHSDVAVGAPWQHLYPWYLPRLVSHPSEDVS